MKQRSIMSLTAAVVLSTFAQCNVIAAEPVKVEPVKIQIATDRQDAMYKCGETVIFQGTVTKSDQPLTAGKVTVRLSNDGMKTISTQEIDLAKSNPFKVEGTMTVPGFLQCEAKLDKDTSYAGAGFEPEKIQPAVSMPDDFKKFWDDSIHELDIIPIDVKLEPLTKFSTPQIDCFKVSFANIDNTRIYGFLSVPKGKKGPFPALVSVPGAGPGYCAPDTNWWARFGVIVLLMNVHKYDPPTDAAEIKKIHDELNKPLWYPRHGSPARDKYYFKASILGINRAINWLAERPDVDKERIAMCGISQGGAFTLIMASLNKNIHAAAAQIPALCDHAAYKMDRNPGWPRMISNDNQEQLKMSGYFDSVNFARNISCPVIVSVGFIDRTSSPSSVYAAYNSIQSPKRIFNEPAMAHSQSKKFSTYQSEWLRLKLGLVKETSQPEIEVK